MRASGGCVGCRCKWGRCGGWSSRAPQEINVAARQAFAAVGKEVAGIGLDVPAIARGSAVKEIQTVVGIDRPDDFVVAIDVLVHRTLHPLLRT